MTSAAKDAQMRLSTGVRCVAWFAVLMLANWPAISMAKSPCPGIHVKILDIRNSTGTVACALFASPDGFPVEFLRSATNVMVIKIRETQVFEGCWLLFSFHYQFFLLFALLLLAASLPIFEI